MKVKPKLYFVCSRSWRACAPPLPEGVLPAVTGLSLRMRRVRSRKVRTSSTLIFIRSLRKTLGSAGTMPCRQLALGRMDPDHPLTAHLSAASGIQVRPDSQRFCLFEKSMLSPQRIHKQMSDKCLQCIRLKCLGQPDALVLEGESSRELWMQEMSCIAPGTRKENQSG